MTEAQKAEQFYILMQEAACDEAFLERTYRCAEDFKYADSEIQTECQTITQYNGKK